MITNKSFEISGQVLRKPFDAKRALSDIIDKMLDIRDEEQTGNTTEIIDIIQETNDISMKLNILFEHLQKIYDKRFKYLADEYSK